MVRMYAALIFQDREPKERIYRDKSDAFCLEQETFVDLFRLSKFLEKYISQELNDDPHPGSGVRTTLFVDTQVTFFLFIFHFI